jgi:hypothetical protein
MNNIITYGADGMVFMGRVNFPVSWHNWSICMTILPFVREKIRAYKICVQQGFPCCSVMQIKF